MLTTLLTQALVVLVLMFSPLNVPPNRLPEWLRAIHDVVPIQAMGEVIRGSLASTSFPLAASSFLLLGAWCLGGFALAFVTLNRRG
jgi:ABC-2 type transport system permease protein